MAEFFFDRPSNVILYPGVAAPSLQHLGADIRQLNGSAFATLRTLRNLQILRHQNYPVPPIMDEENYDWPIERGRKPLPHQKIYANFACLNPKMFNLGDPGCVDADTEYLSPAGWKRIADYDGGKVAQYHKDGRTSFVKPKRYVVRKCSEMLRIHTERGLDQKLSREHRVVFIDEKNKQHIAAAQEIYAEHDRVKTGWRGRFLTAFVGGQKGIDLSEADLRLMVAVIADGCFPRAGNRCVIRVKKQRKKDRIVELLRAAGRTFTTTDGRVGTINEGYSYFRFTPARRDKIFSAYYWKASQAQLRVVADEVQHWDATVRKHGAIAFHTTIKASADFVQYAFVATNRTASLRVHETDRGPLFTVLGRAKHILLGLNRDARSGEKRKSIWVEPTTDGKKYCFEVPTSMLVLRRNGQIFITGNTMKTLSNLWAADFLMRQAEARGEKLRAVIIAPLSILDSVWGAAIFRNFLGQRTFRILTGDEDRRAKLLREEADFYIINHDGIKVGAHTKKGEIRVEGFAKALLDRQDIQIVIVDEATAFKDHTNGRSRIFARQFKERQYVWMLTGTPVNNSPLDAYGMARIINNAHGKSFNGFRMETMFKITNFIWKPQKDGYEKARRLLTPAVRFALEEVWDAPEMTFQRRQIELTAEQKKQMADLKRDLIVITKSGKPIDAANEASARWKYLQIAMGSIYDGSHEAHIVDAMPRYREAIDIIESTERKVVIGVPITSVIHLLKKRLDEHWKKTDFRCDFINGEVTGKERTRKIQEFESDPNFRVMIVDPQAAGHGINEFVVADTLIYFGAIDKTELFLQLNARLRRPGQKYPMTCFQLYATKLESEMFDRLETNTSMQGLLLQAIREGKF